MQPHTKKASKPLGLYKESLILGWALLASMPFAHAQDPLKFKDLLDRANTFYPALQAARLEHQAALQDLEAARRLHWPTISVVVEGTTHKNAPSAPSKSLQVEQTLWDAGGIKARIKESETSSNIALMRTAILQEEVHLQLANAWQNLIASHERILVAQQTIRLLKNYESQMQRRVELEASPRIDLELASSRILQTQVEYSNANNSLQQAITRIEQYTGLTNLRGLIERQTVRFYSLSSPAFEAAIQKVDWQAIVDQHPSIAKARADAAQSQARLDQKRAENWPQIYLRVSQPLSNVPAGYHQGANAFVGIKYSSSAGFANHLQAQSLATRLMGSQELIRAASTDLTQTLKIDQDDYANALTRIQALQQTVEGGDKVLLSYQRQFEGGRKTWQDLLNAVRELAQNQYALADARAGQQGAMYRLQIRSGQQVQ